MPRLRRSLFFVVLVCLPPVRGEESKPIRQLGEPLLRHGYPIISIAYSPDGSLLATAGGSLVRLFKPMSGKEINRLDLGDGKATAAAFSPDGKRLAIATGDQIILHDLSSKQDTRWRTDADDPSAAVIFSPDGARLATSGRDLTIWDVSAGQRLYVLKTRQPPGRAVAFSTNGQRIAAGDTRARDDGCIRLWSVQSGEPLQVIAGVEGEVAALAFTPDGQGLISASRRSSLQLWDVATGKEKRVLSQAYLHPPPPVAGLPNRDQQLALTMDGQTLYSTGRHDDRIREWDLTSGEARRDFRGPPDGVGGLALSPDRKWLAVAGLHGSVDLWHLESGQCRHDGERHRGAVFGLGFTPDGKSLQSACTGNWLIHWNLRSGALVRSQEIDFRGTECVLLGSESSVMGIGRGPSSIPARGPGGAAALLTRPGPAGMVQRWDAATGKANLERPQAFDGFLGLAHTSKGAAAANQRSDPALVEMITGYVLQARPLKQSDYPPLPGGLKCMIHDYVLVGEEIRVLDRQVRDTDLGLERMIALDQIRRRQVQSWAVTAADGRSWARLRLDQLSRAADLNDPAPEEAQLQIREACTGSLLAGLQAGPLEFGRGILLRDVIAFTPNGRHLVLPHKDGVLKVCESAGGQERLSLRTGQGAITSVAISPDGEVLASGGVDGSIKLWDLKSLRARPVALTAQELAECWERLGDEDGAAARQAMWKLVDGAEQSVPFLRKQLLPIQSVPARRLHRLVADLDSNDFTQREKAVQELEHLGPLAEEHLRQVLTDNPPLEVRARIETILKRLAPGAKLTAAERRILRAVAALEHAGSGEARQHLAALAEGNARMLLTREAKRALERR